MPEKYSQNNEEQHIARICEGIPTGRFLDIGSYNPFLFSNTRALYERGWSGVMVEASPGPFMDLLIEYGNCERVELVCAAVMPLRGMVRFHHSEAGVGTSDIPHYQKWRDKGHFDGLFWTMGITVPEILGQFGMDFEFINIDVEGASSGLFLDALRVHNLRPKCWCVEHDGRQEELTIAAISCGYAQYHLNGENVIFARTNGA